MYYIFIHLTIRQTIQHLTTFMEKGENVGQLFPQSLLPFKRNHNVSDLIILISTSTFFLASKCCQFALIQNLTGWLRINPLPHNAAF